ncbi:hypothetical protein K492DRAFT_139124 [Lichtheimia hyalospora FSU 10163]|nr:hypothetical protein K492DRAFT_139124 [Lichtheimia hyalospora FSU 10163]
MHFNKNDDNIYEVQYIITHKKVLDSYEYLVKWKNYRKDNNSWVKQCDFIDKDLISKYWNSIRRS